MSSTEFSILDDTGTVRLSGQAGAPEATAGQILTADGNGLAEWVDGGSIGPVVVTGTPSLGDIIIADSATTAHWGAQDGLLQVGIGNLPTLGLVRERVVADFFQSVGSTITSPPVVVPAMTVVVNYSIALFNVPDIGDLIDITYTLFVTDQTGANSGIVSGGASTATPASGYTVDFTGTTATIVGADLTWDDTTATFTSTAGGVFTALLYAACAPD